MTSARGQASVELLGTLPLVAVIALGSWQLLAAGQAASQAGGAAQAAAMAALQGGDPLKAARAAAPSVPRGRLRFERDGSHMRVWVRPRRVLPGLASLLTAEATADAGPLTSR